MKITQLVEALVAAHATPEMILAAVRTVEAQDTNALEQSRANARARFKRFKEREAAAAAANVSQRLATDSNALTGADARTKELTSNLEIEPQKEIKKEQEESRETRVVDPFLAFWALFPNKVGRADASKAFSRSRNRVDLETLMAGLRRYVAKTDDRQWCNPATWLNQDRWADEPAAPVARGSPAFQAPSQADVFAMIARGTRNENQPEPQSDRGSFRQAIPHLSAVRSG